MANLIKKEIIYLILRYIFLLALSIGNLYIFYKIFTPLTVYSVFIALKVFYSPSIQLIANNTLLISQLSIELIPACIAGAAYYLLLILNLTTPMKQETRIKSILFLLISFLIVNILRIVLFSVLAVSNYSIFNQLHLWTWYLGSTLFVVCLWFINIKLFKIKSIPVYSDFEAIFSLTNQPSQNTDGKFRKHGKFFRKL